MSKLNTPFPNETTINIRNTNKKTKIRTELASSDIEIYQALNYRKKKEFTKPLTLKYNNPLLQSFVKFNFLFPVELIAIDYKTHQVKKIQLIEVKKHTGDFIQGFSEYSIAILAPKGFSKKYNLKEYATRINIKAHVNN